MNRRMLFRECTPAIRGQPDKGKAAVGGLGYSQLLNKHSGILLKVSSNANSLPQEYMRFNIIS